MYIFCPEAYSQYIYYYDIRITTDNEFDTTKEWSIDTNGVIDVMWDFTE